jgi:hypothetical protein
MVVENAVVPLCLKLVAVMRVVDLFRREVLEVYGLAGERSDAGGDEHQPGQQFAAVGRRIRREKLAGLFCQIKQDGVAVENLDAVVVDGGHLGVRIDGEVFRLELVALAGVDGDRLVGEAGFLQEQGDLGRVGRSVEVKFEHLEFSPIASCQDNLLRNPDTAVTPPGGMSMLKFLRGTQATSS